MMEVAEIFNFLTNIAVGFIEFGLQIFTPSEFVAIMFLFLYALNLTREGRFTETIVKTLVGYLVYSNGDVFSTYLHLTNPLEIIVIKVLAGAVAVFLTRMMFGLLSEK